MDRNLGATRAATSSTDTQAYGDLYQWGRAADGHQSRSSGTTTTLSSTDQPGHGDFILAPNLPYDWRSTLNDNLWQGENGINNPCPVGFRIPTQDEWNTEIESWSSRDSDGALNSTLNLPTAGRRNGGNGSLEFDGTNGRYWTSETMTVNDNGVSGLVINNSSASMGEYSRSNGYSVRCIKD